MRLNEKVALITGASSGIGRATAIALAKQGTHLALLARNEAGLQTVAEELKLYKVQTLILPADVTNEAQINSAIDQVYRKFCQLDVLICNAGLYHRSLVSEILLKDFKRMMDVNFYGSIHFVYRVLPKMINDKKGQIVIVSSVDGRKGLPYVGAYVASKFALTGFAEVLRQELYGTGVSVTTVFPGRVDTPMQANIIAPVIAPKIQPEKVANSIVSALEKNKTEVVIPFWSSKLFIIVNAFSSRLAEWIVRTFKLHGKERPY